MADSVVQVLLVEDNKDNCVRTRSVLREASAAGGFDLHRASSYADGRDALLRGGYDVCLLDYRIGEQDGLDLLREVTSLLGTAAPAMLLLTGRGTPGTDRGARRVGAVDYLVKGQITPLLLERAIGDGVRRRQVERECDQFFELSQDLQCVASFSGYFLRLNPSWEKTLDYTSAQLMARPFLDFVHQEDRKMTSVAFERLSKGEPLTCFENRYLCRDGSSRWLQWHAIPSAGEGRIFASARDMTGQKRLQEQVIQSERLAAMGELVAGVAHEINNPLAAISGHAELLQMHDEPQVQEDGRTIQQMTDRATRIVRSLLTFARQTNASEQRCLPLRPLIEGTLEMVRYKLRQSNVEVVLDLSAPDLSPRVNPGQIGQVFINLINNAEHALRQRQKGRKITITTSRAVLRDRAWAVLCISDNGHGIPEDVKGRIFDPFFTTKPQGEGTGLGLSLCHGIAREHRGRLEVASQVGVGTTFTLSLPLAAAPDAERTCANSPDASEVIHEMP